MHYSVLLLFVELNFVVKVELEAVESLSDLIIVKNLNLVIAFNMMMCDLVISCDSQAPSHSYIASIPGCCFTWPILIFFSVQNQK